MGYKDEKLWECLEEKVRIEDEKVSVNRQIGNRYLAGVEDVCKFGIERAITIRDTFPMYTLHDEIHICNVLRLMADLLGERINELRRDEAAMLIMSACCHDIGMSYSDEEKRELLEDYDRMERYLGNNRGEYIKAYKDRTDKPIMTNDMVQNYLRSIHHERVRELLISREWAPELTRWVKINDLIRVCQSHGSDISSLDALGETSTIDLRLCAVLLRLSDILDFDTSRAPQAVYEYSGFDKKEGDAARISRKEWDRHLSSYGFDFVHVTDRSYPYLLDYNAESRSIQVEQVINSYLDWVDQELSDCSKIITRYAGKWQNIVLPMKINRIIEHVGYVSGPYHLSLDHDKVMELLIGNDFYNDCAVFVRELLQNAIDAVRTREKMDKNLPADWKPQINIRAWIDEEGYHWFRIEDNGTGMSEEIILNYLLKVGCSYYTSDLFEQDKIRCKVDPNYTPISRFGIGILSCFMGDKKVNQVEISTKRFHDGLGEHSALRLSMHGMEGFYYMAKRSEGHVPDMMKGITAEEKQLYLNHAGTAIAVRTNLYRLGTYKNFKDILDQYIVFPSIPIHYESMDGTYDYLVEADLLNEMNKIQLSQENELLRLYPSAEDLKNAPIDLTRLNPKYYPFIVLKCIDLNQYALSPYISGVLLVAKAECEMPIFTLEFNKIKVPLRCKATAEFSQNQNKIILFIRMQNRKLKSQVQQIMARVKKKDDSYKCPVDGLSLGDYTRQLTPDLYSEYDACILYVYQKYFKNIKIVKFNLT